MRSRRVFAGFSEGPLVFKPTYKYFYPLQQYLHELIHYFGIRSRYDNGTQTYDSSEKQRIPAWTDRIMYSGVDVRLVIDPLQSVLIYYLNSLIYLDISE